MFLLFLHRPIKRSPMELLKVSDIRKAEKGSPVLQGISFTQQEFQKLAIAGESGSGKSTLLKIIAGYLQTDAGEVLFNNVKVKGPLQKLIPGHDDIAYLSQHFELRANYRVEEILSYANQLTEEEATMLYEVCRIDHLLERRTDQLSGGEKQRIAMARLLIMSPKLFLLDEPFSNLDLIHRNILKTVINDIGEKLKITCLLVSHDPGDILPWADEVLIIKDGQIVHQGTPRQTYTQPSSEYVAGLFGKYNLISAARSKEFRTLPGVADNGKDIFIRPEQLVINKEGNGLAGRVSKVFYQGSHYEIEMVLAGNIVTVRSEHGEFTKGENVHVALLPGELWYL
jgi:ABC-type sugar transport system ATPase subunit